jgi:hypothetical protein
VEGESGDASDIDKVFVEAVPEPNDEHAAPTDSLGERSDDDFFA